MAEDDSRLTAKGSDSCARDEGLRFQLARAPVGPRRATERPVLAAPIRKLQEVLPLLGGSYDRVAVSPSALHVEGFRTFNTRRTALPGGAGAYSRGLSNRPRGGVSGASIRRVSSSTCEACPRLEHVCWRRHDAAVHHDSLDGTTRRPAATKPRRLHAPPVSNLHPGPLPQYAGLNVPSWAIYNGEVTHGVSLHRMDSGIDTGPIAYQASVLIGPRDTGLSLSVA